MHLDRGSRASSTSYTFYGFVYKDYVTTLPANHLIDINHSRLAFYKITHNSWIIRGTIFQFFVTPIH